MLRLVLIALLAIFVKPIKAETWPSRPLTMVVPFATGGPMDAIARILQSALADALQEQVIVENVGGAGGMIGAARVARSAPDGYLAASTMFATSAARSLTELPFAALRHHRSIVPNTWCPRSSLLSQVSKRLSAVRLQLIVWFSYPEFLQLQACQSWPRRSQGSQSHRPKAACCFGGVATLIFSAAKAQIPTKNIRANQIGPAITPLLQTQFSFSLPTRSKFQFPRRSPTLISPSARARPGGGTHPNGLCRLL
jgi:hypothetical protein